MDPALAEFLAADDLDLLMDARDRIEGITKRDAADIADIVESWSDEQAVANLLMYPEVIPERVRPAAVLRALSDEGYLVLAAVLGVQRLSEHDEIADDLRAGVADRLLHLLRSPIPVVAARASIAAEEHVDVIGLGRLLAAVTAADDTVFHNILAVAIRHSGREAVLDTIRELAESEQVDLDVARKAVSHVEQMKGMGELPLLPYIPNLVQWHAVD